MRYIKILGLLAVALAAFATTASASKLTSPTGTTYTSEIGMTSTNWALHGTFVTVKCSHVATRGKVEVHEGGKDAGGKLSSWTMTGCNYTSKVKSEGTIEFTSSQTVFSTGADFEIATSVGTCGFTTNNTFIGNLTDSHDTGENTAVLDHNSAKIPRTYGNFLCGSSGTLTGTSTFTTPDTLYVD